MKWFLPIFAILIFPTTVSAYGLTEDTLYWINSQLPANTYIQVHAEKKNLSTGLWESVISDTQPFRSFVNQTRSLAFWRKDIIDKPYYGEIYRYDNQFIYLYSESYGAPIVEFGETSWDVREDRFRLFVSNPDLNKNMGRIVLPRYVSPGWKYNNQIFSTYICNSFEELTNSNCRLWQNNFLDTKISVELRNNFQIDYDGHTSEYEVDPNFQIFDKVLILNQEMIGVQSTTPEGRERFIYGIKNGISYGIIRWDNAIYINGDYQIIERTLGLRLATTDPQNLSLNGFSSRIAHDPYLLQSLSLMGDLNDDSKIDIFDFTLLLSDFGKSGQFVTDINSDAKVNSLDAAVVLANFGKSL